MTEQNITDKSIMSFGVHKGKAMVNVPATYLIWLYDTNKNKLWFKRDQIGLIRYIEDNMNALKKRKQITLWITQTNLLHTHLSR